MIEFRNISKVFRHNEREITALSEVSLTVKAGEIFGVIGKSGAGKSTLIRCANLLERPTSGTVFIDGHDLTALSESQLVQQRRQIGMIFQHFNLLSSRTVAENVAFPLELIGTSKNEIDNRVHELLNLVGLQDKATQYPAKLSGGQKQRVAIARTLANNPKVLLCDEATSALDPATTRSILALLKDINKRLNITILLITHEMAVIKSICDSVAVIDEGRLIENGKVADVFMNPSTSLAKDFIASALHIEIPEHFRKRLSPVDTGDLVPLLRLEMTSQTADQPILSQVSRIFNVDTNIISAQMDHAGDKNFGIILLTLSGHVHHYEDAIKYFKDHHIKTEILGYV
ncbi:D-methionine ABC transporter, ATP-binding protein [Dyadobacter luteus]|uniref:D-methionine ABC transporter, ATP-binding protein n=1 Tax=Dyadobacter luteus TaxID=2259619 RepID=A0A3D8YG75_9BACT|nr:methionine ABC transporter ATP-binding protein MetN [Dyadobacter luteus]REA63310.1 D-methionine ABC transporter, ATP-binding protein [Dyadobacter luteus]